MAPVATINLKESYRLLVGGGYIEGKVLCPQMVVQVSWGFRRKNQGD